MLRIGPFKRYHRKYKAAVVLLLVIDPPSWLELGGTGYVEANRVVNPREIQPGQFTDPFGRHVFITDREIVAFQRYPGKPLVMADYINNCHNLFASFYVDVKDSDKNNLWMFPKDLPDKTDIRGHSILCDTFGYPITSTIDTALPERFVSYLADGRLIKVNGERITFQRWLGHYIMINIYR